jgi:hypothetical protein
MEIGKIYFVKDKAPGTFWMLGRCTGEDLESDEPQYRRNNSTRIDSNNMFFEDSCWCYESIEGRTYREATQEEIIWFEECERQEKFIPKEQIKFAYEIY